MSGRSGIECFATRVSEVDRWAHYWHRTDPLDQSRKGQQIENVQNYQQLRNHLVPEAVRPERSGEAAKSKGLAYLQSTARERRNVFASLMEAVKTHSLGQISHALYDVGGSIGGICNAHRKSKARHLAGFLINRPRVVRG